MSINSENTKILPIEEIQIRRRVRCISCELVQWRRRRTAGAAASSFRNLLSTWWKSKNQCRLRPQFISTFRACVCELNQTQHPSTNGEFPTIAQMERSIIEAALDRCQGDRLKAAAILGIGKTTIYRKLRDFEIATARAA